MKPAYHYCTVLEALDDLKQKGFLILIINQFQKIQIIIQYNMSIAMKEIPIQTKNHLFIE